MNMFNREKLEWTGGMSATQEQRQFIRNTAGLYVGWPTSGALVGEWVFYEVSWPTDRVVLPQVQPTKLKRVRVLSEVETITIHQHHIMYWGVQLHPRPAPGSEVNPEELVEDALVVCRPSSFRPRYFTKEERKRNQAKQRGVIGV